MRRKSEPRGLWEYRGQWINTIKDRPGYYRFWWDERTKHTKRAALHAVDLQSAKEELISILAGVGITPQHPSKVFLVDVLAHYLEHHATPRGYKPMAAARRASQLCMTAMLTLFKQPTVEDMTRTNQRRVWRHMADNEGLSAKSITTYMIAVRAAINFAADPQIIKANGTEIEVRVLETAVPIFCNQDEIAEEIGGTVSQARQYIPTFQELGRWIDLIEEEDDFRYVIIALNTAARNEAVFDLVLSKQVDYEFGTIDLNPIGRRQTKKRRPVIRLTETLRTWFAHWGDDKPIRQYQDTVEKRLNRIGKENGMPEMTCYTLRHFIATNLRRTSNPVSREQRSKWLGHTVSEGSKTTDWYEKFDPDYLDEPMNATDEIMAKLQRFSKRAVLSPTNRPQQILKIV